MEAGLHADIAASKEIHQSVSDEFKTVEDVRPQWVADFLEIADPEDRAIRIRDAYETVSRLLDLLTVAPWNDA